jgi:hypothetical protein
MTWRALLFADKIPLIVATALTVFGWYVNSISSYFTDETILYVSPSKEKEKDEYLIKNVSLKNIAENVFIRDCLYGPRRAVATSLRAVAAALTAREQVRDRPSRSRRCS